MAVIEYDDYKQKLLALEPTLGELEKALGIPKAREELSALQKETEQDGFWNDLERSQKVSQQIKRLENKIKKHDRLVSEWEDTLTLCEMAQEEDDASQLPDVMEGYEKLQKEISERRLAALLSGEYDANNAILTFHAGAGGTEAQDWTEMLYRMYTRWAERHGYTYQLMDYEAGEEAGIKSATILIEGENAYGYLQQHAEKISDIKGVQMKIEWGSQIRSYVFMPYTLAKDTRTGYEMGNIQAVMDGDIDGFINAYLTAAANGELK